MSEIRISYKQIMGFEPCYDPQEIGMTADYEDTLSNFIQEYRSKVKNILNIHWAVLRKEFFSDRDLRLFGVWSAKQVQHLMKDERSLHALEVAEKFAYGNATQDELEDVRAAAWAAAAWDVRGAAWAAAWAAAWTTAWTAAAWDVRAADAWAAAETAGWAAARAADARAAAWAAQIDKILEMIIKPNGEWYKTDAENSNG